jgi:hypothetical protein
MELLVLALTASTVCTYNVLRNCDYRMLVVVERCGNQEHAVKTTTNDIIKLL